MLGRTCLYHFGLGELSAPADSAVAWVATPLGWLSLESRSECLHAVTWRQCPGVASGKSALLAELGDRLNRYFAGQRVDFSDIPLDGSLGTPFQRRVWEALRQIPYGETRSYGSLAEAIGLSGACRAVGNANGRNPWPIIVPCHRVIRRDGSLGGYSAEGACGGPVIKRYLLELEGLRLP